MQFSHCWAESCPTLTQRNTQRRRAFRPYFPGVSLFCNATLTQRYPDSFGISGQIDRNNVRELHKKAVFPEENPTE